MNIPAGRFVMGAQSKNAKQPNYDKEAFDDWESPPHAVSLDAFCLARYPVTVGQYQRFIADDGYGEQRWWSAGGFGEFTAPDEWDQQLPNPSRPVVGVSWFEAAAFCSWADCRLPTEAEWERAARGTEARKYPWGGEPAEPERLNFSGQRHRPSDAGGDLPARCHAGGHLRLGRQRVGVVRGLVWRITPGKRSAIRVVLSRPRTG